MGKALLAWLTKTTFPIKHAGGGGGCGGGAGSCVSVDGDGCVGGGGCSGGCSGGWGAAQVVSVVVAVVAVALLPPPAHACGTRQTHRRPQIASASPDVS